MKHRVREKIFGFTLVELMIVIVVIGILAAVGYPSYRKYVYESRRSVAKTGLLNLQMAQEKYRTNCLQYATGIHATTLTCTGSLSKDADGNHDLVGATASPDGYYTFAITLQTTNALAQTNYSLIATAAGNQVSDTNCKTLSINQDGVKTSTDSANAASTGCW